MADLHKELLEDQFSDAALLLLMDDYAQVDGKHLLSLYEQSRPEMPEAMDRQCRMQIQKHYKEVEKDVLLRRTASRAGKIAAAFAVCLSLSINLILSVEALRVPCLNFIIDTGELLSSISFGSSENDPASAATDYNSPIPFYAPENFEFVAARNNHENHSILFRDSQLLYLFRNEEGKILQIQSMPATGSFTIDTEDAECTEFILSGMQAFYIKKDSLRVFWLDPALERIYDVYTDGMVETEFLDYIESLAEKIQNTVMCTE